MCLQQMVNEAVEAERARWTELFRLDGEQHAAHVKSIRYEQDARIAAYKAENEKLRATLREIVIVLFEALERSK